MLRWLRSVALFLGSFLLVVIFLTVINASEAVGIVTFAIYIILFLAVGYRPLIILRSRFAMMTMESDGATRRRRPAGSLSRLNGDKQK